MTGAFDDTRPMKPAVVLRPLKLEDLEALTGRERGEGAPKFDDFGFRAPGSMRRRFEQDGFLPPTGENGRLAIVAAGKLAGTASWAPVQHGPNRESLALNIGVVLMPAHQAKGIGNEAVKLLTKHLFAHTKVHRIECVTDAENVHAQRMIERVGFKRDGTMRGAQYRDGSHHDLVLYSFLRGDETSSG